MAAVDPFVSVIIPVYNDARRLQKTLKALHTQTYPTHRCGVIVVDNGSTDESVEVARSFPGVKVLSETDRTSSPYSARNRGIEAAQGEIIALLDATCVPVQEWMAQGVRCLVEKRADLVGGNVEFSFQDETPTAGELHDALMNIRMKESVEEGKAKTANLFVRRRVFDAIGLFPEGVRSGGDVRWTRRATGEGRALVFCEKALVYKAARKLRALIKKQWRVGKGQPAIWEQEGRKIGLAKILILAFIPFSFSEVKARIHKRERSDVKGRLVEVLFVNYLINFTRRAGQGYTILSNYFCRK